MPQQINSAVRARRVRVDAAKWLEAAQQVRAAGGGLIAVWGSDERDRSAGFVVRVALREARSVLVLELAVPELMRPNYGFKRMRYDTRSIFLLAPAGWNDV